MHLVRKQYRALCLRFHPDKSNGDEDKFKRTGAAYELIKSGCEDLAAEKPDFEALADVTGAFSKMKQEQESAFDNVGENYASGGSSCDGSDNSQVEDSDYDAE